MPGANLNQRWARAIVEGIVSGGAREAVVCPGSRSTPLALACAEQPGLRTWSVIDERSAAFFALGMAKHSGLPVILVATSGTAPAHFYPAVIEASLSRIPLVVLSADRPWELHGFGAPQTIDQEELFGRYVRRFDALPLPDAAATAHLEAVVQRAVHAALHAPRGPVHLNVPFREPLAPVPDGATEPPTEATRRMTMTRNEPAVPEAALASLRERIAATPEGVIVCGPRDAADGFAEAVHRLAAATGYPIFAEAASQVRSTSLPGPIITRYDAILRNPAFAQAHRPKLVLRFGGGITSKRLQAWLDGCGAEIVVFSEDGDLVDPSHRASRAWIGDAAVAANRLARALSEVRVQGDWSAAFAAAQKRAEAALAAELASNASLTEPRLAREVAASLAPGTVLFVSSSMPIRDIDGFAAQMPGVRVLSNRGANGIDGVIASALGAAASSGRPTVLLIGDVAFLHDVGSLLIAAQHRLPLTIVIANNDGGGIFSFLPIAKHPAHFETLFGTPHGLSFEKAAQLFGGRYLQPTNVDELRSGLADSVERGLTIIEARAPSRVENVAIHEALGESLAAAVGAGPWR